MSKIHWYRMVSVVMVMGMLTLGMGSAQAAHAPRAMDSVTLVLKWVPQAQFGGYFAALDKGFYRQAGLDVKITPGGPDIVPEQVVASGGAQFGIDWLSALLVAHDTGLPLENIAQIYQASGMRLIAWKSSGINSIMKFRGHKVGVWPSGNQYQFLALMTKEHMSPASNYMTVKAQGFVMDPFLHHQLDVAHAMTYNELGVVLEHGVKLSQLNVFDYNKLGVSILEDGIMAKPSWVQSHRNITVRFLRASIRGWQYAVAHPDQAGQMSFNHAPSGTTTLFHQKYMARQVAKLIHYGPGMSHPIGYMSPMLYHRTWSTLLREGIIKKVPVSGYDQSYWKAATRGM